MSLYQFSQFHFDTRKGCLYLNYQTEKVEEISLRHKIANLLTYLIDNRDRVISKDELLNALWDHGEYRENALTQSIRELRKALGDNAQSPSFIRTFPQRGYQWIVPLEEPTAVNTSVAEKPSSDKLEQERQPPEPDAPQTKQRRPAFSYILATAFVLIAIWLLILKAPEFWFSTSAQGPSAAQTETAEATHGVQSLLVLPFINATDKSDMAWLELGLADMLAIELQRNLNLQITPPAVSHGLLLDSELQWPTLPVHIRSLLNENQLQAALFASVRLHNDQQVLDFQLIYANGKTQQGSISYPSLPAAVASIGLQLGHLLTPGRHRLETPASEAATGNPIAAQAMAQGIQTQQKQGTIAAQKYFAAAQLLTPDNPWGQAYLGQSELLLGNWQRAETLLASIPSKPRSQDRNLNAFIHYWLAELAFRQGHSDLQSKITEAIDKAEAATDVTQMARSYRLQAQLAWQQMDWETHRLWLLKADRLLGSRNELHIKAENLFYLGNPSNEGLEKNPLIDLQKNQQRLQKALNFYDQLGHQPMIAASQLAIAQNYSLPLETREHALNKALAGYRQLQQPYELAQVLIYTGFYQMQLHNGKLASRYFNEAKQIAESLGAHTLLRMTHFYLAFATLDQGLDQSSLGNHGRNDTLLRDAINQLERFIKTQPDLLLHTSALTFIGWAHIDLKDYTAAEDALQRALRLDPSMRMPTTAAYVRFSLMHIYLEQQNYSAVIAMADHPITTRLQAIYLARAYYENGQPAIAATVLQTFKQQHAPLWQQIDEFRLAQYMNVTPESRLTLNAEPMPYLVYCESDWSL